MNLRTKLFGVVFTLALTGFAAAGSGVLYQRILGEELKTATQKTVVKLQLINASRAVTWEMVAVLRGMFVFSLLENATQFEAGKQRWSAAYQRASEQASELRPLVTTEQGRESLSRFESALVKFKSLSAEYTAACKDRRFDVLATLVPKVDEFTTTSENALQQLDDEQRELLQKTQVRSERLAWQSLLVGALMTSLLIAMITIAVFVVRSLSRTLGSVVTGISRTAHEVSAAANEISATSQALAQGATAQSVSIEGISASSVQINSRAHRNTEDSRVVVDMLFDLQEKFRGANRSLDHTVAAMAEIRDQGDKVSRIIKVIDDVAFQTNILALNAAVEAARAGDAGLGFAVVADEVRNLASRCAEAAKETATLIEESNYRIGAGKARVDEIVATIQGIVEGSGEVRRLVEQLSKSSIDHTSNIDQVTKTIARMERVTQQAAVDSGAGAAAADELSRQLTKMRFTIEALAVCLFGERRSGPRSLKARLAASRA